MGYYKNNQSIMILLFLFFCGQIMCTSDGPSNDSSDYEQFHLVSVNFHRVGVLMVVSLWILLVCITITSYHYVTRYFAYIPESCILIILGIPIGCIYRIVLDAGYFVKTRAFFENIIQILLHAVLGTLFNAFVLGAFVYGLSGHMGIPELGITHCFLFGSLISAVDPVAVLAVFNELQVHELLFIVVFGESILNDAVTIVLYNLFEHLTQAPKVTYVEVLKGFASFFIVSVMGVLIGIFFGLLTAFVTKYTRILRLLEPVIVLVIPYIGYLLAETFHFSGILSILFTGIIMKPYVEINVSYKSKVTIQRSLRAISTTSEAIIFVFLGCSIITFPRDINMGLIFITIIGISVFRCVSIIAMAAIANAMKPREKISWVEQFVMIYGGLRGAVAISLALILEEKSEYKSLFVTTAFAVVIFTVFIQGITIKPLVHLLKIKREPKKKILMLEEMNFKIIDQLNNCAIAICGTDKLSGIKKITHKIEEKCENFLTDKAQIQRRDTILAANTDILYKEAAKLVKTNPSAIINLTKSQANIQSVQSKSVILEDVPTLDTGAKLRLHQANFAKGQNLFDNYIRNMDIDKNKEIGDDDRKLSNVHFMTRNESFYGPGAGFTINRTSRPNVFGLNRDKPINLAPEDNLTARGNYSVSPPQPFKQSVGAIPLLKIEESPEPIFTIGKHDSQLNISSIKEISSSIKEQSKTRKDHNHSHKM